MPYTNPWSNIIPAGGDIAGPGATGISAQLRRLKLDIEERMSNLVVDWQADPVVLQSELGSLGFTKFYPNFGPAVPRTVKALLAIEITAVVDAILGTITIDFAFFAEVWPLATDFIGCPIALLWDNTANDVAFAEYSSNTATTVTFKIKHEDGGNTGGNQVQGRITFLFSAIPA